MTPLDGAAVMICGHGSRDTEAISEFNRLVARVRDRLPGCDVESGFLEFARPTIGEGLAALKSRGARRILCVPGMLFAAGHVKNDLPSEIGEFAAANPELDVRFGRDLAIDPRLLRVAAERIEAAERAAAPAVPREESLLMVVGRGTNDPDANSNVAKVARMLWEGLKFGWAETSFSGVAYPLLDAALDRAAHLGCRRIVVFPYFLFTGRLVKRIYAWTDAAAARHPETRFVKAAYLDDHPLVVDTFLDRIGEMLTGGNLMNCAMCKYRERMIGYEGDLGAPQAGHHHHVRGIGTDGDHGHHHHDHHHHHDGDHGHVHHHPQRPATGRG